LDILLDLVQVSFSEIFLFYSDYVILLSFLFWLVGGLSVLVLSILFASFEKKFFAVTWLVLSELYPSGIKGRAMSFCNIINWVASLAMSLSFLHTMTTFTIGGTFIIFSVLNFFSALYIFLVVPETEGKSLEKISYELRTM
jgi:MFS transporter, SP family, arabinose:H+ symporter